MVSLQSVIIAIRVNSLYGTEVLHFHEFLLMTAERGNWLSVRVTGTPGSKLELRPLIGNDKYAGGHMLRSRCSLLHIFGNIWRSLRSWGSRRGHQRATLV